VKLYFPTPHRSSERRSNGWTSLDFSWVTLELEYRVPCDRESGVETGRKPICADTFLPDTIEGAELYEQIADSRCGWS
jgi:hypothetical protein